MGSGWWTCDPLVRREFSAMDATPQEPCQSLTHWALRERPPARIHARRAQWWTAGMLHRVLLPGVGLPNHGQAEDSEGGKDGVLNSGATVSGGADSMALAILADGWAKSRGGTVVALTVDHRLRRGSGTEARLVASRLRARHMEHHVLRRSGRRPPRPEPNLQAAARTGRAGRRGGGDQGCPGSSGAPSAAGRTSPSSAGPAGSSWWAEPWTFGPPARPTSRCS